MKMTASPFSLHFFICTNHREGKACCAEKGAVELRQKLKERLSDVRGKVRVNASGCLGFCEKGITAMLYPEGKCFTHLQPDDINDLELLLREKL